MCVIFLSRYHDLKKMHQINKMFETDLYLYFWHDILLLILLVTKIFTKLLIYICIFGSLQTLINCVFLKNARYFDLFTTRQS